MNFADQLNRWIPLKKLFRIKNIDQIIKDAEVLPEGETTGLKRDLSVVDLTALGIAAVIGAGIFSTIGNAAASGGPGVVFLFVFTAIACGFSALCYAEFASSIPIAGSAYTYAYASMGELLAWIIGWDLLMEYSIGNIAVAISWSDYFTSLLNGYGIHIPAYFTMDYLTASRGFDAVKTILDTGTEFSALTAAGVSNATIEAYQAFVDAPRVGSLPMIMDLPAMAVNVLVTAVIYVGIRESKRVSNLMVLLKIAVLLMIIGVGAFYIKPENWSPFAPNGVSGILKGVSGVFFAYIGFDAISTTAEETKNPQRDLPRAMIAALIICTILYILVALVLTGIVSYEKLGVGDPLAFAFGPEGANLDYIAGIVAVSAVVALFTVLLVFQLGQPRIWMAMSRDGLLPKIFSSIHPKFKTPWFSTLVTGALVGVPVLFMNLTEVTDLTSIGTLFAFILVCAGVLRMDPYRPKVKGRFYTPYINGKWIFPVMLILTMLGVVVWNGDAVQAFLQYGSWEEFKHKIPLWIYLVSMVIVAAQAFKKNWSMVPLLGLASCGYLMTELGWTNWLRFGIWLALGLIIYFMYGYRNSKLAR